MSDINRENEIFENLRRDWEEIAILDPFWAVLTNPGTEMNQWNLKEFFRTGEETITHLLCRSKDLGIYHEHERVLDFGCGVGRLSRELGRKFKEYYGVDISGAMIQKAKELHSIFENCIFFQYDKPHLEIFPNDYFDFICSILVLQHFPTKDLMKSYISEFVRILKRGGAFVFQVPNFIEDLDIEFNKTSPFRRLRKQGYSPEEIYEKHGENPVQMNFLKEEEVLSLLRKKGAKVVHIEKDALGGPGIDSRTYYGTK